MKSSPFFLLCVFCAAASASAGTYYVDRSNANPAPPYSSWSTAATNIQDAVGNAPAGSLILVTNGLYDTGSTVASPGFCRVVVTQSVTIQSINGPAFTIIKGTQVPGTTNGVGAVRGVYLASGAVLSGFTVTNGATPLGQPGGGIYCQAANAVVTNCVITGNASGGAGSPGGGGVYSGTLINCILSGNITHSVLGGGAYNSFLTNCILFGNRAYNGSAGHGCKFDSCTIISNTAGSLEALNDCSSRNSIIYYNYTTNGTPVSGGTFATNCCMFPAVPNGTNNFTNAPLFQNLAAADFHMQPISPYIDAGNSAFVAATNDLDGNRRIRGLAVDVGAYEFASIHYVNLSNSSPASPYMTWASAATNIQDAVDAATNGDFVLVSNGVYQVGARAVYGVASNRVVIDKAVTVQSVNGNTTTSIVGANPSPAAAGIRCVYMTNGALLSGFLLTNGSARSSGDVTNEQSGGGLWCESASAVISNCVFLNCYANQNGGAVYRGTLYNCIIATNVAFIAGGGAFAATLNNCTINSNRVIQGTGGGGIWGSTANNCLVVSNFAFNGGGGYGGVLSNCTVRANRAGSGGGGGYSSVFIGCTIQSNSASSSGGGTQLGQLQNCVVKGNFAPSGGGLYGTVGANSLIISNNANSGGGAYGNILTNCTVVGNNASSTGGGVAGGTGAVLNNSIIYYNTALAGPDLYGAKMNYCCTPVIIGDIFSITNPPQFVDLANGDFRLQSNSPCINSGANTFVSPGPDLAGNPRVANYTVDIGAYESQASGSVISYAWLQQYGLPTDGSVDYADNDGDGMSNWQEWHSQTNPTNSSSLLVMQSPQSGGSGPVITWKSVSSVVYYLQRGSDLANPQSFTSIRSNLFGHAGTTSFTDTTATGPGPYFYRVGVQ